MAGEAFVLRGVEVCVAGTVAVRDGSLVHDVPHLGRPIALVPLAHKLQWHFRRAMARQPGPDAAAGHDQVRQERGVHLVGHFGAGPRPPGWSGCRRR